jgi:hypothetical protein
MHKLFKLVLVFLLIQVLFNLFLFLFGFKHPYNIFLFDPNDRFADILKTSDSFGIADTWPGDNSWYRTLLNALPPFQLFLEISFGYIVSYTKLNGLIILFLIYSIIISSLFLIINNNVHNSIKRSFFLICILNYGFITFLDRGNSSILTFIFLLLFLIYIDNPKLSMLGLVISISLKITPIYFFIIIFLFKKEKLKLYIFYFLLYLFLINIFSYIFVSNFYKINLLEIYNLNTFLNGGKSYLNDYLYDGGGIAYGSSLITFFSFLLLGIKKVLHFKDKIILPLSQLSFFLLLSSYFFIYLNKRFFLKEKFHFILFVFVTYLLFSPVTGDYYLSYLVLPLLYYNEKINSKYLLPIVLLLSPKNYIFYYIFSIQIIINPIIMCIILYMIYVDIKIEKNTTFF